MKITRGDETRLGIVLIMIKAGWWINGNLYIFSLLLYVFENFHNKNLGEGRERTLNLCARKRFAFLFPPRKDTRNIKEILKRDDLEYFADNSG